ncbi:NAD(P)/FAD-dependent oxidoreductase [Gulosibacter sp. 10]|uniref:flavin monoamine oxidase family protein n=1 Tax=Gulosibacter sp. 10 TaxID=1255570 RepID=UPI00097E7A47|nr:NAD(P)/FAD-dependent oxidoreductase [Gulosibacter sp. 10]SJM64510.1 amine oxidase [Gulosibacter sp. 10]
MSARIAVLGAGLAGLAAATRLVEDGHDVVVFEARERAGGRLWSETIRAAGGEHVIERGAEFVLDGYTTLRKHCANHGLELVDTGMSYYVRTPADRPGVTTDQMAALGKSAAEAAAELAHGSTVSVADILDRIGVEGDVREAIEARIEMSTAVRVDQATAEETLEHVASFERQPSWRIGGGNQGLPDALAAALGDRVRYGARVEAVRQAEDAVSVTAAGADEQFDYVVVALPFGVLDSAEHVDIDLPDWKREAMSRVVQGHAAKIHLALNSVPDTSAVMNVSDRFWTWTAIEQGGAVAPVLNGFGGEVGRLKALGIEGDSAEWERLAREQRADLDLADAPAVVTAWTLDPLAEGAYTAHAPGFSQRDAEALAAPHGRLYFAGEYIDREFGGLMEGALRSGEEAAAAITATATKG